MFAVPALWNGDPLDAKTPHAQDAEKIAEEFFVTEAD
jgi:hypothetical protein